LTILDHFSVFVDLKSNTRQVLIPCIDERGYISDNLLDSYPNLLGVVFGGLVNSSTIRLIQKSKVHEEKCGLKTLNRCKLLNLI